MNLTEKRKIEEVMQRRIARFRKELAEQTIEEILNRKTTTQSVTKAQYERYTKSYEALMRAHQRIVAAVEDMSVAKDQWGNHTGVPRFQVPYLPESKSKFDVDFAADKEQDWVKKRRGDVGFSWLSNIVGDTLRLDEKKTRKEYPTLVAWYEKDKALREFQEEELTVEIYISDGDASDLLAGLDKKLNELAS